MRTRELINVVRSKVHFIDQVESFQWNYSKKSLMYGCLKHTVKSIGQKLSERGKPTSHK